MVRVSLESVRWVCWAITSSSSPDAVQKLLDGADPRGKACQDAKFLCLHRIGVAARKFQIIQISQLVQDGVHRLCRMHLTKARDHGADIADASGVLIFLAQLDDAVKVGFPIKQRCPGNLLEHRATDASGSLIADAGKRLEVAWVKAQRKKGDDIQHDIVLFKPRLVFPNIKIEASLRSRISTIGMADRLLRYRMAVVPGSLR